MRKLHFLPIVLIAASLLISSCEKTIDVNTPPFARKLAVNSNNELGEPLYIVVGTSAAIKDQKNHPELLIKNANIRLYVNDTITDTLVFDNIFGFTSSVLAEAGKKYTVVISSPSYENVEASVIAPSVVPITSIVRTPLARRNEDGDYQDAIVFTFIDPPAAGDYYILRVDGARDSFAYISDFCVNSSDPSIETNANEIAEVNTCLDSKAMYIRDELFNGRQKEIKLYVNSAVLLPKFDGNDSVYAKIELFHVPEAYFRFSKSSKTYWDTNGNPFAEPVNVYTNVTKGLGIFSIVSKDEKEIR
ncbi:MAG: DUF4249 domain-containing protein [Taibaiella sp.]|nr:DUF4249 domain-containing protein [Taibaiella sp.]